jgi:hypothetical protein
MYDNFIRNPKDRNQIDDILDDVNIFQITSNMFDCMFFDEFLSQGEEGSLPFVEVVVTE